MRDAWALDDSIHFLNHGSYGATPRAVLERQRALRDQLECEPVRFMKRELPALLDEARNRVATFIGASPADVVFVPNATTAINAVLRSFPLQPGDELLTTSHAYNACLNTLRFVADRAGARVVVAPVPLPCPSSEAVLESVLSAVTPKTKLVLIDQITSPTALVFPIDALAVELESRGVAVLVDAAHAPGQVPLHVEATGAAFTTGNLHKWVCAPKGAAFLHVRRDWQERVRPSVISHGANSPRVDRSRFLLEFDWVGTIDPTAWLAVPAALDTMAAMVPGGWPALMQANHEAAVAVRRRLLGELGGEPLCPDALLGAMAAVEVPWAGPAEALMDTLFHRYQLEVPIIPFAGKALLRVSMQRHVRPGDLDALSAAIAAVFEGKRV